MESKYEAKQQKKQKKKQQNKLRNLERQDKYTDNTLQCNHQESQDFSDIEVYANTFTEFFHKEVHGCEVYYYTNSEKSIFENMNIKGKIHIFNKRFGKIKAGLNTIKMSMFAEEQRH